jgi:hypothetical protein
VPLPQAQAPGLAPAGLVWEEPPRGASFAKFALILVTALILLAALAFAGLRLIQARQHHLAEGYLYRDASQVLYFHIEESFFGGGVAGTFYSTGADCQLLVGDEEASYHVSGEVTDQMLTLADDEGDTAGSAVNLTFRRAAAEMVLTFASGTALAGTRTPIGRPFQPASDDAYHQTKEALCPPIDTLAGHGG